MDKDPGGRLGGGGRAASFPPDASRGPHYVLLHDSRLQLQVDTASQGQGKEALCHFLRTRGTQKSKCRSGRLPFLTCQGSLARQAGCFFSPGARVSCKPQLASGTQASTVRDGTLLPTPKSLRGDLAVHSAPITPARLSSTILSWQRRRRSWAVQRLNLHRA